MKTLTPAGAFTTILVTAVISAKATTYTGAGVTDGSAAADGGAISSVVINNTASTISFTINSTLPMASYIYYGIEIMDTNTGGGTTSLVNPWGPHVGVSTGINALVNTYGTGAAALTYSGGNWTQNASSPYDAGGTGSAFATMTFSLASLGLNIGDSFTFDVVSSYTGGTSGQAAYGALDNPGYPAESDDSYMPWLGSNFYDSATAAGSTYNSTIYNIQAVPEPSSYALLTLGGVSLLGRKRIARTLSGR